MATYLVFIAIIVLLFQFDYVQKKSGYGLFALMAFLLTFLLVALRYYVGFDYDVYSYYYLQGAKWLADIGLEPGFVAIVAILRFLGADSFWLFFWFGFGIIYFIIRGIKLYTDNVRLAFLIYLLIPGLFINSLSIIRQALAIAILFNAYYYYYYHRYRTFAFLSVLAFLFHYSSVLVIPFILLAPKLRNRVKSMICIGIPLSLILYQINFIDIFISAILGGSKFIVYTEYEDGGASFIKLLVLNVSMLFYLFFYRRMDNFNRSLLALSVMGLLLLNACASVGAITRISYYFKIFEIVVIANVMSYIQKPINKCCAYVCVFVYFFIMFYSSLYRDYTTVEAYPKMTPYQSIFEK